MIESEWTLASDNPLAARPNASALRRLMTLEADDKTAPETTLEGEEQVARTRAVAEELDALYRRHHRLVFKLALRYGRGDRGWAEDVTHDVFLGLFDAIPHLARRDELEGWLYRATTHRCLSKLRRERLYGLLSGRWLFGQRDETPHAEPALAARSELRRALAILDALPPKERVAFSMYYLDEKEQEEIGETLGHSKGQVSKLIARAVERLRARGIEVPDG